MAIDTKSLSDIISDFRALTAKDSITPESLGYILQRIADRPCVLSFVVKAK